MSGFIRPSLRLLLIRPAKPIMINFMIVKTAFFLYPTLLTRSFVSASPSLSACIRIHFLP